MNLKLRAAAQPHVTNPQYVDYVTESTRMLLASGAPFRLAEYSQQQGLASTPEGVDVWVIEQDNGQIDLDPATAFTLPLPTITRPTQTHTHGRFYGYRPIPACPGLYKCIGFLPVEEAADWNTPEMKERYPSLIVAPLTGYKGDRPTLAEINSDLCLSFDQVDR